MRCNVVASGDTAAGDGVVTPVVPVLRVGVISVVPREVVNERIEGVVVTVVVGVTRGLAGDGVGKKVTRSVLDVVVVGPVALVALVAVVTVGSGRTVVEEVVLNPEVVVEVVVVLVVAMVVVVVVVVVGLVVVVVVGGGAVVVMLDRVTNAKGVGVGGRITPRGDGT